MRVQVGVQEREVRELADRPGFAGRGRDFTGRREVPPLRPIVQPFALRQHLADAHRRLDDQLDAGNGALELHIRHDLLLDLFGQQLRFTQIAHERDEHRGDQSNHDRVAQLANDR